ncbi:hypothetical protein JTB14_010533 [Gonioctena quinquepunctata]|nr:hypothetical protein JTB14_010533 [Gonioctena quinquepunctata]
MSVTTASAAGSSGMIASTLDNFSGKEVIRYFEKLEQRASLDSWTEEQTLKLLKFKLIGEAYSFFKSDHSLNLLSFVEIKARFIEKFLPIKLPGENQLNLSRCFQRHDEDVSSYCIRLRNLGSKLLKEDLESAQIDEVAGLKKKNKDILLNQFKIGLRKDLLRETGILLLKEEQLDLDKAEKLVKLQETTTMMINGKNSVGKVAQLLKCGKFGHISRDCRSGGEKEKKLECYLCHKEGHYANVCPEKKVSRKMQIGTEELDVVEMDVMIMDVEMRYRHLENQMQIDEIRDILLEHRQGRS